MTGPTASRVFPQIEALGDRRVPAAGWTADLADTPWTVNPAAADAVDVRGGPAPADRRAEPAAASGYGLIALDDFDPAI